MSATWESISMNNCKVKVQAGTGAHSTVISSKLWTELGKPKLHGKMRLLEAYNGHQLRLLASLTCDVEWNGSRLAQKKLAMCSLKKNLVETFYLTKHNVNNITTEHLPAVKGNEPHVKLIPRSQPMFCKYLNLFKTRSQRSWKRWSDRASLNRYSQAESLMHLKKCGRESRAENWKWVDLKVHINGKVMDEDCPKPDMETIFQNLHVALYFGKIDLLDAYYQNEFDEEAKDICRINTCHGLFKMCLLAQGLKNFSSIFQKCIESTLKGIKSVVIFQEDVLVYGTTKKQFDKRMLAVKSRLREKNLTFKKKKSNSKPVDRVSFWDTPFRREE